MPASASMTVAALPASAFVTFFVTMESLTPFVSANVPAIVANLSGFFAATLGEGNVTRIALTWYVTVFVAILFFDPFVRPDPLLFGYAAIVHRAIIVSSAKGH